MAELTGQSKCFHLRKAFFLHAYDYSKSCSPVDVSIWRTKYNDLYLAFHYRTAAEEKTVWDIINSFGALERHREKMDVSDRQLQSECVEMSRDELVTFLKAHREERLRTGGPTSKSIVDYELANRVLPKPDDWQDSKRRLSDYKREREELEQKRKRELEQKIASDVEASKRRQKEEAEAKQRAEEMRRTEEDRKQKIISDREASKLCIMCGRPLGFVDRVCGNKTHRGCKNFSG